MTHWPRSVKACLFVSCLLIAGDALAFKLKPHATLSENRVAYLERSRMGEFLDNIARLIAEHFTSPVHEEITHRIWGCEANTTDSKACLTPSPYGKYAPPAVLFGVQWNDNPPFALTATRTDYCPVNTAIRLPNYAKCWVTLYRDASKRAQKEHFDRRSNVALIYRVHFGDMQFLHSMASWDGEKMADTKARILMWMELAYKTATGEIAPELPVSGVPVTGIPTLLGKGYSVQNLLTRGIDEERYGTGQVALGSFMHVIQDSFAKFHVGRDAPTGENCPAYPKVKKAGRVLVFYSYIRQDKDDHSKFGSRDAFEAHLSQQPNVILVGRALKDLYDARTPWAEVRSVLDQCVFEVADDDLDKPAP